MRKNAGTDSKVCCTVQYNLVNASINRHWNWELLALLWYINTLLWCRFTLCCLETMKKLMQGRSKMISGKSFNAEKLTHSCCLYQGLSSWTVDFSCLADRYLSVYCIIQYYCLSNAVHGIGQISNTWTYMYVCLVYVGPAYTSSTIATVVFARSLSNLESGSHEDTFDGQQHRK